MLYAACLLKRRVVFGKRDLLQLVKKSEFFEIRERGCISLRPPSMGI